MILPHPVMSQTFHWVVTITFDIILRNIHFEKFLNWAFWRSHLEELFPIQFRQYLLFRVSDFVFLKFFWVMTQKIIGTATGPLHDPWYNFLDIILYRSRRRIRGPNWAGQRNSSVGGYDQVAVMTQKIIWVMTKWAMTQIFFLDHDPNYFLRSWTRPGRNPQH